MAKNTSSDISGNISSWIATVNEKNPFLIIGLFSGVLLIFFYLVFFQTKVKETTVLGGEIRNLQQSLEETENNLARKSQYVQELVNYNKKLDALNRKIKAKEDIPAALEKLSQLASDNNVKIEQMMPDEGRSEIVLKNPDGNFTAIPVVIGARSSYHDFGRFVNKVEESGIFLGISDFGISTNTADSNQHLVKLVLRLVIFEKVENKEAPARIPGRRIN